MLKFKTILNKICHIYIFKTEFSPNDICILLNKPAICNHKFKAPIRQKVRQPNRKVKYKIAFQRRGNRTIKQIFKHMAEFKNIQWNEN